jgi:hypothetical protein
MAPAIDPVTTTVLGTMLRDIIGDPTDIVTIADLIGGTDTGGITAGIGIKIRGGVTCLGSRTEDENEHN